MWWSIKTQNQPFYTSDRDTHGEGILVFFRDDIPSKEKKTFDIGVSTEGIFIEWNFRKSKWLLLVAYMLPDVPKAWFHSMY